MLDNVINHLLDREPWARAKLAAHAGKVAVLDAGVFALRLKVEADGLLSAVPAETPPNVTIRVNPSDLPLIAQDRARAFSYVTIEGDADFASSISQVAQNVQWEAEEDIARLTGDIAAARIVAGARSVAHTARRTHQALAENLAEYLTEEKPVLIRPPMLADMATDVTRMRDDVERLLKRIEKLESKLP